MTTFKIRSESKTYSKVEHPAAVFDRTTGVLFAIGESDDMKKQYDSICSAYIKSGYREFSEPITYMDLPRDQDEIDNVFQISGYIKGLYERTLEESVQQESAPTITK